MATEAALQKLLNRIATDSVKAEEMAKSFTGRKVSSSRMLRARCPPWLETVTGPPRHSRNLFASPPSLTTDLVWVLGSHAAPITVQR